MDQRKGDVGIVGEPPVRCGHEYSATRHPGTFLDESRLLRSIADVLNHCVAEHDVKRAVPERKAAAIASNRTHLRMDRLEPREVIDRQPHNPFGPRVRRLQEVLDPRAPALSRPRRRRDPHV
jgi:hypothetical protein